MGMFKRGKALLVAGCLLFGFSGLHADTFDFSTGANGDGTTVTQTISGVTVSVTSSINQMDLEGAPTDAIVDWTGGNSAESITVSFSEAVDITTFYLDTYYGDLYTAKIAASDGTSITVGQYTGVSEIVGLHKSGITSFTISDNNSPGTPHNYVIDTIGFTPITNTPPTSPNRTQTVNFNEDITTAIADMVITDPDSDTWTATVTMASANDSLGSLSATSANGETFTAGTGVWTITSSTKTAVNTALAAMSFVPKANVSTDTTASVSISDGVAAAITGTITFSGTSIADTPSITNATTNEGIQSSSGLVVSKNVNDGTEVTHYKITSISNGTLYKNNGTTAISNNAFITIAEGSSGLKFTPSGTSNGSFYVRAALDSSGTGLSTGSDSALITVIANPTITSATYDVTTGSLVVTGTDFQAKTGALNDVDTSSITLTGEGGDTYTLVDTADVEISNSTSFTLTLSSGDKLYINGLLNKNGTTADGGTTYNLAVADDWMTNVITGDTSDATNGITVSNVLNPTVTSATYDVSTGVVVLTGTNFTHYVGATNDIDISTLTFTGESGATYSLTSMADIEVASATYASITLAVSDKIGVDALLNKDGVTAVNGTTYNLAAADNWMRGAASSTNISDLTANGITVSNANAVPIISNLNGDSYTYTEGDSATLIDQGNVLGLTDSDSADFNGGNLTVTITAGEDAAEDLLSFETLGVISLAGTTVGSNVSVGGSVIGTLGNNIAAGNDLVVNFTTGDATPVNIQTLMRSITYENTDTSAPTTGARNVRVSVNDGDGGTSSNADVTVTVAGENDSPTISINNANLSYTEDEVAKQIDSASSISDVDGNSDWNGGTLVVQITANNEAADELSIPDAIVGSINTSGTNILNGMTVIGTLSASEGTVTNGTALTITFNSSATNTLVQQTSQAISYRNTSTNPGTSNRTVTYTVTDKNSASSSDTRTIVVTAVDNETPTIRTNLTVTLDEGATKNIRLDDLEANDEDTDNSTLTYTVTSDPSNGHIENTDSIGTPISSFTQHTLTLGKIQYVHDGTNTTSDSFIFKVADGTPNELTGQTFSFTVTAVDDETSTVTVNTGLTLNEGATKSIAITNLAASDADTDNATLTYTVTSALSNGQLENTDNAGTSISSFTQQNLSDGKIQYVHDGTNTTSDIFTFKVADGVPNELTGQTFSITVNAVNNAPVLTTIVNPTDRDEDFSDFNITLHASDFEGDAFRFSASSNDSSKATVITSGNQLVISSVANAFGSVSINVIVTQENNESLVDGKSINFTINSLNDAPTINTLFEDISLNEDNGTTTYDLNVSDIDGDDLNITIDSNNTDILRVTTNLDTWVNQATWTQLLDFNLTTQENANGVVRITVTANDGELNTTQSFDVNVTAVNDVPVLSTTLTDLVKEEDFTNHNFEVYSQDVDNDTITYSASSSDISVATVSMNDNEGAISSVLNASGTTTITLEISDGEHNITTSYELNVTAVDDAPTLEPITNIESDEDRVDFNVTLNANDVDGHTISYTVNSSNEDIATVTITDGKLVVTQVENAYGLVNIEVNATSNGLSALRDFNLTVSNVNDAPNIDTVFSDLVVLEDAQSFSLDVNISDIDGDDLNLSIESNNTELLAVTQNYTNLLNQGNYDGVTLDFNLTAQENANGIVEITITLDDTITSSSKIFEVEVSAINDDLTMNSLIANINTYKNFDDMNISLGVEDVDGDTLDYNIVYDDSLVNITAADSRLIISSIAGVSGVTDVNLSVSDAESNATQNFTINILSLEDGDGVEERGEVELTTVDGNETLRVTIAEDNLEVQTVKYNDNTVSHKVVLGTQETKAISNLINAIVELIPNGVRTKYEENLNALVEVIANLLGQTIHRLTVGTEVTEATFESAGALSVIDKDSDGNITVTTTMSSPDRNITIIAREDGSSEQNITKAGTTITIVSKLKGTKTVVRVNGDVETLAGKYDNSKGYYIKIKFIVKADGTNEAKLIRVNKADSSDVSDVTNPMFFPEGTKIEIFEDGGMLYMKATVSLTKRIVIK